MRLFKHQGHNSCPTTYTIKYVSITELGYIQLALIMAGQEELRTGENWAHTPIPKVGPPGQHERPDIPADGTPDADLSRNLYVRRAQRYRAAQEHGGRGNRRYALGGVRGRQSPGHR